MKDSGVEWLGEIPESWTICKCKYLFSYRKQIVGNEVSNFERLALTLNGVIKRSKDDDNGLQPTDFSTYQILRTNQLVFKLIDLQNVSTSRVGLSSFDGIVSPAYIILEPSKSISPKFAEQYFLMLWHRQIFNQLGDAGVRSSLNAGDLLDVPFVLPPIDTQNNIVDFLDSKKIWIKSLTDNLNNQIDKLKDYKKALITKCVTKGLDPNVPLKDSGIDWIGKIPENWILIKLKFVAEIRNEKNNDKDLEYIALENVESFSGNYIQTDCQYDLNQANVARKNDVLFGKLRPYLAKVYFCKNDLLAGGEFIVFNPKNICNRYLFYILLNSQFIDYVSSTTNGTKMPRTSPDVLGNILFPMPSIENQMVISNYLDAKCSEIDSLISSKQQQIDKLNEYQKSLIYEYVIGKKEVI